MSYAIMYSSNKLLPTIIKAFSSQTDINIFITQFKLCKTHSYGAEIDFYIDADFFDLSDPSIFSSLNSLSIDRHLHYKDFVQIAIVNSFDSQSESHIDIYQILDHFTVY